MSLTLHYHPLSSFCMKALIALYETGAEFTGNIVDFFDEKSFAELRGLWPVGKIPVLVDHSRGVTLPEASIIVEHLGLHYPGKTALIPEDHDVRLAMRLRDRFYDLYVNVPMQKIVTDKLRPAGKNDAFGVEEARALLATSIGLVDDQMKDRTWAMGEDFTMADCAAAPPLFYAAKVIPFDKTHPHAARYLKRLMDRPSFARALREAEPYFEKFPG